MTLYLDIASDEVCLFHDGHRDVEGKEVTSGYERRESEAVGYLAST